MRCYTNSGHSAYRNRKPNRIDSAPIRLRDGRSEGVVVHLQKGQQFLSSLRRPGRLWGPCSLLFNRRISPRINRPAREADHSPSSSVEVRSQWSSNFTSPYIVYGLHRGDFTFSHLKKSVAFKKRRYTAVLSWMVRSTIKRRRNTPYGLNGLHGVCISET